VVLFAVLGLISVSPLFFTLLPPFNDYPNHLARMHILSGLAGSEDLRRFYSNVMLAQPNLAMDLIVPLLAKLMPLQIAGKVFIGLTALLTAAGTLALHYAVNRRWSFWPLVAFLFVFHRMMLWGLLNYCFGIGVMLVSLAIWLAIRQWSILPRILISALCAVAIYISHLYAFGLYAIAIGGIELWFLFREGTLRAKLTNIVASGVQFLLPAYLFLFLQGPGGGPSVTRWGSVWRKLEAPFDVIYQYHVLLDVGCLLLLGAIYLWGLWKRRITLSTMMLVPLGLLVLAFLAMPNQLFSGYGADRRLPIAALLILIAASDWQPRRGLWREPVAILLALIFVVRTALLLQVWVGSNAVYSQYFEAAKLVPRGSKILPLSLQPGKQSLPAIPLTEAPGLFIVLRDAFVPTLFTSPPLTSESVSFAPGVLQLGLATRDHIRLDADIARMRAEKTRPDVLREPILSQFDYVIISHPEVLLPGMIPSELKPVYRGSTFLLLKVPHPG